MFYDKSNLASNMVQKTGQNRAEIFQKPEILGFNATFLESTTTITFTRSYTIYIHHITPNPQEL